MKNGRARFSVSAITSKSRFANSKRNEIDNGVSSSRNECVSSNSARLSRSSSVVHKTHEIAVAKGSVDQPRSAGSM